MPHIFVNIYLINACSGIMYFESVTSAIPSLRLKQRDYTIKANTFQESESNKFSAFYNVSRFAGL